MKTFLAAIALAALAGCGLETAGTAASGAAIKKQEIEQGKKTMDEVQQKIGQSMEQMQQSSQGVGDADNK